MQVLSPTDIYKFEGVNGMVLPRGILDVIESMQLIPVAIDYSKKKLNNSSNTNKKYVKKDYSNNNWRTRFLRIGTGKKTEIQHDDPDFEDVKIAINIVASSTIVENAKSIQTVLLKRSADEEFRYRVVTFMFNRGVSMPFYSKLMANIFEILFKELPIIKEDLQFNCSLDIFNSMFDQTGTIVYPSAADPDFENKLIKWYKNKEIRRGFGMFITELHIRGLVDEDCILSATKNSFEELEEMMVKPIDKDIAETVDQLVTFLYESTKVIFSRFGNNHPIVVANKVKSSELYKLDKKTTPCLGMRSRFKLDDISKLK